MCDLNQTSYDMRTFGFDISTEDKIVFVIFIPNPHIDVLKILVFRCLDGTCRGVPAPRRRQLFGAPVADYLRSARRLRRQHFIGSPPMP